MADPARILILFSDTGGGHRSAAEAVAEALEHLEPQRFAIHMVDIFKEYAPPPLNLAPAMYPYMVRIPSAYRWGFRLSDGHPQARLLTAATWPYVRSAARRIAREHRPDLVLATHPLAIAPVLKAFGPRRPPFLTVVTDLVSAHALWYHRRVDLCLVPTEAARQRALVCGLSPERVRVVGLPVSAGYCQPAGDRPSLRAALGWPSDRPMVLVVSGAEGMGPLFGVARAIARPGGDFGLAIVAGRNERLRQRLQAVEWEVPTFIYGFERRLPEMMQAATLLVTKAGPGTIAEALNAGLPMVLFSRLPGQEEGNVAYVVEQGVGVWAPGAARAAQAVLAWLSEPEIIEKAAAACRRIARPQAANDIARIITSFLTPADPASHERPASATQVA
ncbi:MAG: glycosyltransferase [Chloroflexota bacterium]